MVRASLVALIACVALLPGAANACTILPSLFEPGSPETIAEQRAKNERRSEWIAEEEIVFVGRMMHERSVTLGEIVADMAGVFGDEPPAMRSWIEPVTVLKGSPELPTTNILSDVLGGPAMCGRLLSPKVGDLSVVYASRRNGKWVGDFAPMDILPYLEPLLR